MVTERKKEIVNTCLDLFVERGLYKTSTRDLSKAMKLQSGGLYYYFQTKDEAVIACVEAAIRRLEDVLILPVKKEIKNPANMMSRLLSRANEMAPVYQFVVSVCSDKQYKELTKPILDALDERYIQYSETFAKMLNCKIQVLAPFFYMCITAITNYMVFEKESFVSPQLKAVQLKLERIIADNQETNDI